MPAPALKGSSQTAQIMLTGKLQLPQGFSSLRRENDRSHGISSTMDKIAALNSAQERGTVNSGMAAGAQEEKENDEEDELESYDGEREHTMCWEEFPLKTSAQKETAEEKKLRKQLVKEQNRLRRCAKKEYKMAFKHEYLSQVVSQAKAQDINSVRVFKYTV